MGLIKQIEEIGEIKRKSLRQAMSRGTSEVQKFYDDAVVFVTGASGFLGKQLVEKLLSSTDVKKIYLLLRSRKGKNVETRFQTILDDPVYDILREEDSDFVKKLIPIEGDVSELNLGMDDKDWLRLTDEVKIIFHSAATINFEDPVKKATLTNVRGTREMLRLAKSCKHLKSVVHVSTAFSNATKSKINGDVKEDFYTSPIDPDVLIKLVEHIDEDKLDNMMNALMSDWPNTYTFTKAVTEDLVRTMAEDLPVCIIRPAVVIGAYNEPSPGWVDVRNAFGPSGLILGIGLGVIHTVQIKSNINLDYVPVDFVNNATIVAAWDTFIRCNKRDKKTAIYTITSARNRLLAERFCDILKTSGRELVTSKALWYCFNIETSYTLIYIFLTLLLHYIPAAIVDGLCILLQQKPRLLKLYKLERSLNKAFKYFTINEWNFHDGNTVQLFTQLSDVDKKIYHFNMADIDLEQFILRWAFGIRKYIIKDDAENIAYAHKKHFWFKIAHYIIFPIYLVTLFSVVYFIFVLFTKVLI